MPRPPPSLQSLEFPRSDSAPPRPKPPEVAGCPRLLHAGDPSRVPIVAGPPAAPAGSKRTVGTLTSRATDPGRTGPGWAEGPRVPPRSPGRCLRRREPELWLRRKQPARPGRHGLALAEGRSSPAAALSVSARGPHQKASPPVPLTQTPGREHEPPAAKFRCCSFPAAKGY